MKELVESIARELVDNPDQVVIRETECSETTVIEVKVADSDVGQVIGKSGRIVQSIRAIAGAVGHKNGRRVRVDVVDPQGAKR